MDIGDIVMGGGALLLSVINSLYLMMKDRQGEIRSLSERLAQVEVKVQIPWSMVEKMAIDTLHHPNAPELDRLLELYQHDFVDEEEPKVMREGEVEELLDRLAEKVADPSTPASEVTAAMLLSVSIRSRFTEL